MGKALKFLLGSEAKKAITTKSFKAQVSKTIKRELVKVLVPDLKTRNALEIFFDNYKELGFGESISKASKYYITKSINENVPMVSLIKTWKRDGAKATIKRFLFNRVVPHEIKKFYYFFNGMNNNQKKQIAQANEEAINDPTITNEQKLQYLYKLENILEEVGTAESGMNKQQVMKNFFNFDIKFRVISPQTGNFAQSTHLYNAYTQAYTIPIRSGSGIYVRNYTYEMITLDIIKMALMTHDYGVVIFNRVRRD